MEDMIPENEALEYYRKLMSLIYREIGAMWAENHLELYDKSKIGTSKLRQTRKEDTKCFYHKSKSDNDVGLIDQYYVEWSGLILEEVLKAFQEGDWLLDRKQYSWGGPKWARVTETTLALREIILNEDWQGMPQLVDRIKNLRHNTGWVVEKFKELGP